MLATGRLPEEDAAADGLAPEKLSAQWRGAEAAAERLLDIANRLTDNQHPRTTALLQLAVHLAPERSPAWTRLAWRRYADHERAAAMEAAQLARKTSRTPDELANASVALGWFHLEQDELDLAEAALRPALEAAPQHAMLHTHLGNVYLKRRDPAQAAHHLSQALQRDPSLDDAAASLAWALHDQAQWAPATTWARHALTLHATPQRQAQLAWLLLRQGQPEQAIPLLRQSLAEAPDTSTTYVHLARALSETCQHALAHHTLAQGLARFPDTPELLLAMAWTLHGRHGDAQACALAERLITLLPGDAGAWHLRGVARAALGHTQAASADLEHALQLDAGNAEAAIQLALLVRKAGRTEEAAAILVRAAHHQPEHAGLCTLRAQIALDRHETDAARTAIHALIARTPANGHLWYLLAQALQQREHLAAASTALRRAVRHDPSHAQAWLLSAWLAQRRGHQHRVSKAVAQWLLHAPDTLDAHVQAAFVLAESRQLAQASTHAEQAVAYDSTASEAWRALAHVRQLQGRLEESEGHARHALGLCTSPSALCLRQLAWVLRAQGRLEEAAQTFQHAAEADPASATGWYELADTLTQLGATESAWQHLERALAEQPPLPQALQLRMRLLVDAGPTRWEQATQLSASLLGRRHCVDAAASTLMLLAALGHATATPVLCRLPREERRRLARQCLESAQARSDQPTFHALACWAQSAFPEDLGVAATARVALGLNASLTPQELARSMREWQRQLTTVTSTGAQPSPPHLPGPSAHAQRMRLAYVAAHFHHSLLAGVLAAHDPRRVDVFLYCDLHGDDLRHLPRSVQLFPLRGLDLVASMHANRIDVAIDTVGVTGVLDQDQVLLAFARRVAPVQCAWLGSWAASGGVFDYLLTDEHAVAADAEGDYDERIVRLPGGQWAWTPPPHAPDLVPPPCLSQLRITLACPVRAFRIGSLALRTWMQLLQRLPQADLVLMGEHGANATMRTAVEAALIQAGLEPSRVRYQAQCPYDRYLENYNTVDILLDSFPANGGLCLLDALWMGVPCVSLAGHWLGERQGLSVLAALGHSAWVARDPAHYVDIVCALASAPQHLAEVRRGLRHAMTQSPLLDSQRLALAIEDTCLQLRQRATPIAQAPTPKERARAVAALRLETWLSTTQRIKLAPRSDAVDISVVVVLFNQVGLSRQCFAALADQRDACLETIVVDNASNDRTAELLQRLDGAIVLRNARNVGFLEAANQGAARARGRHILFLNNDAIVHAGALCQAARRLDADGTIGAVGGRIVLGDGTLQEAGCIAYRDGSTLGYGRGQDPHAPAFAFLRDVDFCSGAFLMLRRTLWQDLGGFDPVFAPAYYEDTDLCLRIQDAGYRVVYDPSIWLTHFEWASATAPDAATQMMEERRARFATRHRARLAARPESGQAIPTRDRWLTTVRPRILLIDNAVPHMAGGGGLPRARLLVHALAARHHLTLFPLWDFDDDWRTVYASVPEYVEVMLGHGAGALEAFLEERAGVYDFLLVSRPPNMALVEKLWARRPNLFDGMRLVYDAEAVFALREIGQAGAMGRPLPDETAQRLVQDELALGHRAETVLCVSAHEADLFRSAGARQVIRVDHAMPTRKTTPAWEDRTGLLFVGAIHSSTPNEDSLLWFCEHVMQILRGLEPDFPCIDIVGDCTSEKVAELASHHVRLVGRVDDLTPWYDGHRVFVAPTRFGAGVPAKVIEAACNGIPVVATPLLVRQLGWRSGNDIVCGEDPAAFAQALLRLYRDRDHWNAIRTTMARTTQERYDPTVFQQTLDAVFANTGEPTA
jgi:predicted O-linked N-acetylglucosamine transferase (SPINDLY family)/GT2 family glycosyltransferase